VNNYEWREFKETVLEVSAFLVATVLVAALVGSMFYVLTNV
jgi:hypothetical protein